MQVGERAALHTAVRSSGLDVALVTSEWARVKAASAAAEGAGAGASDELPWFAVSPDGPNGLKLVGRDGSAGGGARAAIGAILAPSAAV
jgi:hypothetical protein